MHLKSLSLPFLSVSLLVIYLFGAVTGFFLKDDIVSRFGGEKHREVREKGFTYINPLLECYSDRDAPENSELRPFKHKVENAIQEIVSEKKAETIALYFRDLNNGPWFTVGETENFAPASLLKVPLMIALLKQAESDPAFLQQKIVYRAERDYNENQAIKSTDNLKQGKTYVMDELIYRMIVYSDNNAYMALMQQVNREGLMNTYRDLGVIVPGSTGKTDFMSVESYASFFRVLFNASFLSKGISEKALQYLANSELRSGLVAGVPPDVPVAHKFGERFWPQDSELKQFHDCGIVYYPDRPYLLCIMSRGRSSETLNDSIREISHLFFEEISAQQKNRTPKIR
ncbi:MAG: serine hydrolase [Nitrospirae bacterium]|nr:serine hydrolase [Nitrospirota bacterium]